jgi:hypothetical protein
MISKELVNQLQDAGFPLARRKQRGKIAEMAVPTLSELIEACEPKYFTLEQEKDEHQWTARQRGRGAGGKSPEEAVARLWLIQHALRGLQLGVSDILCKRSL